MTDPTPIETRYAGCRFRSRLEARTAVFFDHLRIEWLYEPEGYEIGPADRRRRYLPDFYLPQASTWIEVKGSPDAVDCNLLADAASKEHGLPLTLSSREGWPTLLPRIVVFGPIPDRPLFHQGITLIDGRWTAWQQMLVICDSGDPEHSHHFTGIGNVLLIQRGRGREPKHPSNPLGMSGYGFPCPDIHGAYTAARSARFEHGEQG
ncbi:hypothetical protein ACH4T9_12925 [Micromonospora sp. NPDC020750]|uniref:hypothetical protein n=1 Tax=unclassified Micromonospora TaxID=2617518 RepID=UPI0037A10BF9